MEEKKHVTKAQIYILLAVIGILSGGAGSAIYNEFFGAENTRVETAIIEAEGDAVAKAAEKIASSVVSIISESTATSTSFFSYGQDYTSQSAGTGIIVSTDGYILTNKHVVDEQTSKVTVVLADGTEFDDVTVVDRDPTNDVAFLKIADVKNMPAAEIGASSELKIGTKVLAVGNALGQFQNTVTSGIISGLNRSITASDNSGAGAESLSDLIQTDAAINSGNSGGPLITYDGKVVGMNTAVAASADGIGFAIPADALASSINSVIKNGKIEKAYLGVYYVMITKALAKEKNLAVDYGAYVGANNQRATVAGSPADKAGVKSGDIITAVNDQSVDEQHPLSSVLSRFQVGDKITLTILRDGKEMALELTLEPYAQQ
ncbi:MAG: trypsin-like peptidase domain-containing protein [Candidatus Nomurabacteria bacterium]|jgi:serine protease Do|nr:trypsin-like peptidase domain-containing protein [Candidatus Nomurabacteria bacterium]